MRNKRLHDKIFQWPGGIPDCNLLIGSLAYPAFNPFHVHIQFDQSKFSATFYKLVRFHYQSLKIWNIYILMYIIHQTIVVWSSLWDQWVAY